ncbi:DUF2269 family protein [Arenimonas composti]|uniref:DUF2269 domain-containing protein n=1 Tax=Arenimonas composti TR7-09 = DSM 18010 TaxID=1121013 RepID=A0A091BG47_9GAMM|nr:DUF2269 domain-containing protein [Arenimonas composti]KFN50477.1 hypothetical protein P873_07380 [Arenimonas composti TR7-09 = DSM 18010]
MDILVVKWLHVLSSTLLFGTGIGSAFYLLLASLRGEARTVALVATWVVRADWLFTATTVLIQPLTGIYLAARIGYPLDAPWLRTSLWLYAFAVACWLPVVWLQIRMRDAAVAADRDGAPLPPAYFRLFRAWIALGVPAFAAFLAIFGLMIARP